MEKLLLIVLGIWLWGMGFVGGDWVFGNNFGVEELKFVFDEVMVNGLNLWDFVVVYGMRVLEMVFLIFMKNCKWEDVFILIKFILQIVGDLENLVVDMLVGSFDCFVIDYIDIYWIYNLVDVEKWMFYFILLVKSGKVKWIGVFNYNFV